MAIQGFVRPSCHESYITSHKICKLTEVIIIVHRTSATISGDATQYSQSTSKCARNRKLTEATVNIFGPRLRKYLSARASSVSEESPQSKILFSVFFFCTLHASIPFERYLAIVVNIWFIANILVSTVDSWNCSTPRLCLCVCYARPAPFGRIDRVLPSLNFTSHRIIICLRSDITNNKIRIHIFRLWLHRTSDVYY